jgi:ABC-2 type transport system ATP-binding protein
MGEAPIRLDGLTRNYGKRRGVTDLTFEVEEGEIFGFLGPNGAGKTTTIRQLMGHMRPTGGSASVFGLDCWRDQGQGAGGLPSGGHPSLREDDG